MQPSSKNKDPIALCDLEYQMMKFFFSNVRKKAGCEISVAASDSCRLPTKDLIHWFRHDLPQNTATYRGQYSLGGNVTWDTSNTGIDFDKKQENVRQRFDMQLAFLLFGWYTIALHQRTLQCSEKEFASMQENATRCSCHAAHLLFGGYNVVTPSTLHYSRVQELQPNSLTHSRTE